VEIRLDPNDKAPPFEQIKASIIELVASGSLPSGTRLPPIRQLAGDLGFAPNTVARAYRELESEGFVRSRGRRGTTVTGMPANTAESTASRTIEQAITDARRQGLDGPSILALVSRSLARN